MVLAKANGFHLDLHAIQRTLKGDENLPPRQSYQRTLGAHLMNVRRMLNVPRALLLTCALAGVATAGENSNEGLLELQERSGEPFNDLSESQLEAFINGKISYSTPVTIAGGLGPIFNKTNCTSCHGTGLIIGGTGTIAVTFFGGDDKGSFVDLGHLGGPVFQLNSITSECHELNPSEIPEASIIVNHVTNGALAYGLVEAIPDATLFAMEDPFDTDGDGVSGRVHVTQALEDEVPVDRAGRFGWKAQIPTVLSFSADASLGEMGLTNRLLPDELAPNGDAALLAECDTVADPEDFADENGLHFIDRVTDFQRYLAPPPQTPKNGMLGEQIFNNIGCNKCHTSTLTTADDPELESFLRNREFKPYGDFLLHCMGTLGDGVRMGNAFECEMKTPPLWGLRWRSVMLHDGRAANGNFEDKVTTAILEHGLFGEATGSMEAFDALSSTDKAALVRFLDSLGRVEFDYDGDEDVDILDFYVFAECFASDDVISPEVPCAIGDIDQDGDADSIDANFFLQAYDGVLEDCNQNGTPDLLDILDGTGTDADQDGALDECNCPGDINQDGVVNGVDLANILGLWGTSDPAGDVDGDGTVSGPDLAFVLGSWGLCQ